MSFFSSSEPCYGFGGFRSLELAGTGHVKYNPVDGTDVTVISGRFKNIIIKHHCITGMKEYEGKSLEELRLEDYNADRSTETICRKHLVYRSPRDSVTWGIKDGTREEITNMLTSGKYSFKPSAVMVSHMLLYLHCQTIRIGSYEYAPTKRVYVTKKGIEIEAPSPNKDLSYVPLHIQSDEILQIRLHTGKNLSVIFLYTNVDCAKYIRESLSMVEETDVYYDPMSKKKSYRIITLRLSTEFPELFNSLSFFFIHHIIDDISLDEASEIYARSCSKDNDESDTTKSAFKSDTQSTPTSSPSFGFKPTGYTPSSEAPAFGTNNNSGFGTSVFGAPAITHASVFGTNKSSFSFGVNSQNQNSDQKPVKSVFGAPIESTSSGNTTSLFSFSPASTQSSASGTTTSLFGAKPLFSFAPASTLPGNSNTTTSLFGAKPLFSFAPASTLSGNSNTTTSLFGAKPLFSFAPASTLSGNSTTTASLPLFGFPPAITQSGNSDTVPSLFGAKPIGDSGTTTFGAKPIFSSSSVSVQSGDSGTATSLFNAKPLFGFAPANTESGNNGYTPSFLPTKPPFSPLLLAKPDTSIFASAPVTISDKPSILASPPVSKSGTPSIFASPPVSKSDTSSIFAPPPVSKSDTPSIFASPPVSKSDTPSIFASAPISKSDTSSIFASPPVPKSDKPSIFASAPVTQSDKPSIFASPPVSKSDTPSIFASAPTSTESGDSGNSALSNTTPTQTPDPTSDAPAVNQSDLNNSFSNLSLEGKSKETTRFGSKYLGNEPANILFGDLIVHNPVS